MVLTHPARVDIEVRWLVPEHLTPEQLERARTELLSDEERDTVALAVSPRRRTELVASRALTRLAIAAHTGLDPRALRFGATERDRPTLLAPALAGEPLDFNLTHTAGLVACALARGVVVGLDAEALDDRPARLDLADHYFAPSELADLRALPADAQPARYFELWTLKESYLKAWGLGLGVPLRDFAFSFDAGRPTLTFAPPAPGAPGPQDSPARWSFHRLALTPRHQTVLAVTGPEHTHSALAIHVAPLDLP